MTDKEIVDIIIKLYSATNIIKYYDISSTFFNDKCQCTRLNLYGEQLKEIPKEIYKLKHLNYLDLRWNKLTFIPDELNYIKYLRIYGNPIFKSKDKVELLFNRSFTNE